MKLASYKIRGRTSFGAVIGEGIVDLRPRLSRFPTLFDVLRAGALEDAKPAARGVRPDFQLAEAELLPPIHDAEKIFCVEVNFAAGDAPPQHPSHFTRTPGSLVGHDQPLLRPKESSEFDYEGEIALVIGHAGRRIRKDKAAYHLAGLTLCNDGTMRDWTKHGQSSAIPGKNFDRSGAIGPWIVTTDELDLSKPLHLTTTVNGEARQHANTGDMIFSFADLVAYVSVFTMLRPGDVVLTGSPAGTGAQRDPPLWLKSGDVIEISVPEIGVLRNRVAAEE
jgi:5-carboxymethyl-2-hydroxymuconate isomerase